MLACIRSATVQGARGLAVLVEVHVTTGLPSLQLVGQPDGACREDAQGAYVLPCFPSRSSPFHCWRCHNLLKVVLMRLIFESDYPTI